MNYRDFTFSKQDYIITHRRETFTRTTSGKSWKKTPDEIKTDVITPQHYENYITSIPFFNGFFGGTCRAEHNYTAAGYLPDRMVTTSPDHTIKHKDFFSFTSFPMYYARRDAGYRENDVLDNIGYFEFTQDGEHKLFTFYHTDGEHSATYDAKYYKWVG